MGSPTMNDLDTVEETLRAAVETAANEETDDQVNVKVDGQRLVAETRWEDTCRGCWEPIGTGNVEGSKYAWGPLWQHGCGRSNPPTEAAIAIVDRMAEVTDQFASPEDPGLANLHDAAAVWADELVAELLSLLEQEIQQEQADEVKDIERAAAEHLDRFVDEELADLRFVDEVEDAVATYLTFEFPPQHGKFDPATGVIEFSPDVRFEALADWNPVVTVEVPFKVVERED